MKFNINCTQELKYSAIGLLIGLVAVSKLLSGLLAKFHGNCFYCIAGLSLGSIVTMFFNSDMMEIYGEFDFRQTQTIVDLSLGTGLLILWLIGAYMLVRVERKRTIRTYKGYRSKPLPRTRGNHFESSNRCNCRCIRQKRYTPSDWGGRPG